MIILHSLGNSCLLGLECILIHLIRIGGIAADGEDARIRTSAPFARSPGFQNRSLQPLGYVSVWLEWQEMSESNARMRFWRPLFYR